MELVAGLVPRSRPAVLRGHARRAVRGAVYPGVVPAPGASVEGLLCSGIDAAAWQRLDAFEGELYERRVLPVETDGGTASAGVYVVRRARRGLLAAGDWDRAGFEARHLADYLEGCRRFASRLG